MLASGQLTVDEFWREVATTGTPLIEPADRPGERIITFVWRGGSDVTSSVLLQANKLAQCELERVPGTDVWHAGFQLRDDWRGSYRLTPNAADPQARPQPDPRAHATMPDRWGGPDKSVAALPHAPAQPWNVRSCGTPEGELAEHSLVAGHDGGARTVWTYRPAHDRPAQRYPLLVLLDGDVWARKLEIGAMLDNLIAAGRIPPLVAVLVDAVDVPTRQRELACHEPFLRFLTEQLTPWAQLELAATSGPARTIIAGQSLSGLTAAFAGLRASWRFGNVLSQSGSFWFAGPQGAEPEWLTHQFVTAHRKPVRLRLEVGLQEWVVLERTRRLRDVLRTKGYALDYVEFNGGHDYACWRGNLADGLQALTSTWLTSDVLAPMADAVRTPEP